MCRKLPFGRCLFRLTSCSVCRILASPGGVVAELEQATDEHPQHPTTFPGLLSLEFLAVVTPALFRPYTQPPHFIARCIVLRGICLRLSLSPVLCTHSRDGAIPATAWVLTAVDERRAAGESIYQTTSCGLDQAHNCSQLSAQSPMWRGPRHSDLLNAHHKNNPTTALGRPSSLSRCPNHLHSRLYSTVRWSPLNSSIPPSPPLESDAIVCG